jgi:hypothetical protein
MLYAPPTQTTLPRSTIMETFYNSSGQPSTAYVKDTRGYYKTIFFSATQRVTNLQAGCH